MLVFSICRPQASGNVAGLCNWAAAMCTYHAVEKDVEPKLKALRAAEAELRVAEKEKNAALAQLATVQASLDDMQVRISIRRILQQHMLGKTRLSNSIAFSL